MPHTKFFNYNITRPYQTTYYFALHKKLVVLSNDTDVIVGLIYQCHDLLKEGLKELWFRAGVGTTTRYIPVHVLVNILGPSMCEQISAMHCLTGHDANGKFGTKLSAIKQLPKANLLNFGKDPRIVDVEEMIKEGERYLVTVMKSNSSCKSMDDLRYDIYHHTKSSSFVDLPPTSLETRGHCVRAIYNTYQYTYAMLIKSMPVLNPNDYAYEELDGLLVPSRYTQLQPEDLIQPCNCKACATS